MHHWQNFIYIELHSEDAYLYEKSELCLTNFKALRGELGFHPHAGSLPFSLTDILSISSIQLHVR